MVENNKYIEALDTLIRFYQGKIAELEAMKLNVISEGSNDNPKCERRVVDTQKQYDIMRNCVVMRLKYSDGTYEDVLTD